MELRVLRYFLAVAREQNISKAADALHVTQPTLSRQIMDLEDELGTPLLLRGKHTRRISLTDAGVRFYNYAAEIVQLSEKAKAELREPSEQVEGDVYIGAGESDAMRLVARTALKIRRNHPNVRYHLFSGNASLIAERLDKSLVDIGIFIGSLPQEKYAYKTLPKGDRWGILAPQDSPLAEKEHVSPADLAGVPLFVSQQAMQGSELSGWFGPDFKKLNVAGTYNLIFNASLMAEEGLGCVLGLENIVAAEGNGSRLRFVPLEPPLVASVSIAWRKSGVSSRAARLFLDEILREAEE